MPQISTMKEKITETVNDCGHPLNITLLDEQENFKKISPFKLHKSLNLISETWEWIKYTNNYQTLTITEKSEENIQKFLQLKSIEINKISFSIKINKVIPFNHIKGVIYSKSLLAISDEEILKDLESQNVLEMYRFKKHLLDGTIIESGSISLTFSNNKRPEMVKISFLNLAVYPIIEKPMQCKHCMLIGHTIKRCTVSHETYCKICFHRVSNDTIHECMETCKNCRGSHLSNLKTCPAYQKEEKILQLKTSEQISYHEAKILFNTKPKNYENINHNNNDICSEIAVNSQIEKIKNERDKLELINKELVQLSEKQGTTIKLLLEENEKLNHQLTLTTKKVDISKKITDEIRSQLQKSTELNENKEKNLKSIIEQYRKTSNSSQYWGSLMRKFINKNEKSAKEFQEYMNLNIEENDSSEFEDQQ